MDEMFSFGQSKYLKNVRFITYLRVLTELDNDSILIFRIVLVCAEIPC